MPWLVAHEGFIEILTQTAFVPKGATQPDEYKIVPIDNSKHTYLDMNKHYIDMTGSTASGPQYFAP